MQVRVAVGEKTDFKIRNQFAHLLFVQQQGRHGNQGGAFERDALLKSSLGSGCGPKNGSDNVVDQIDGVLHGGQQHEGKDNGQGAEGSSWATGGRGRRQ
jgi:hypothetical protein